MALFKSNNSGNNTKPKLSQIIGGIIGSFDEAGFEFEAPSLTKVSKTAIDAIKESASATFTDISGVEIKSAKQQDALPSNGTLNFADKNSKVTEKLLMEQKKAADIKKYYQQMDQDLSGAKYARDRMIMESEIRHEVSNMPTQVKNEMLGLQADYRHSDSIYHIAELRRKLKEQQKQQERQQKATSMAQTGGKASAMNAALEGGSGTQGGGQANLSFQAAG